MEEPQPSTNERPQKNVVSEETTHTKETTKGRLKGLAAPGVSCVRVMEGTTPPY